jgi:hypothetical protein
MPDLFKGWDSGQNPAAFADLANKTETSAYTITSADGVIFCDGMFTVTLPAATGGRDLYLVMNIGSGTITIVGDGSDTINGATSITLAQYDKYVFYDALANAWDAF